MIDEYWTWAFYGYHSDDLSYGSSRPIVVSCDECCQYRVSSNNAYRGFCRSCGQKRDKHRASRKFGKDHPNFGKRRTEEQKHAISESLTGDKNHFYGKHHNRFTRQYLSIINTDPPTEVRRKISDNHADVSGSNNPAWKGGASSSWKERLLRTKAYKNWRKSVFNRDVYTCQMCGDDKGGNLQAHHITPVRDSKNTLLIFDIDNGITLCKKCHNIVNGKEYEFIEQFEDIIRGKQI